MKFKSLVLVAVILMLIVSFTGCSTSEVALLEDLESANSEAVVSEVKLSANEKAATVFAKVTDRQLLDVTKLSALDKEMETAVVSYMNAVNNALMGTVDSADSVIDKRFTDYILMCFEKTPYTWIRSSMLVRGVDAVSGSVVLDVTYKTNSTPKTVVPDSKLPLGSDNYQKKLEVRYQRYVGLLESKLRGDKAYSTDLAKFEKAYGKIADILKSQRSDSLTDEINSTRKQKTYSNVSSSVSNKIGGTMVFRYVLEPQYTLGINQGYSCSKVYMLSYDLDTDLTDGREVLKREGLETLTSSIYNTLYSYYRASDECDYSGIANNVADMSKKDKAYQDWFDTAYLKHDNFTVTIFSVEGSRVECGVTLSRKERAKGTNMNFPVYSDRVYYVLELEGTKLKVTDEVLLSRVIEGEPQIEVSEADYEGFTSDIDLTDEDKLSIESLVSKIGVCQLNKDFTSEEFSKVVDLSISTNEFEEMKASLASLSGEKRVTWIISYLQGADGYSSVRCRELFQHSDGKIFEAESIYSFIKKGGDWYISDYEIASSVGIDAKTLATKNALCVVSKSGVDSFVSQVDSNEVEESTTSNEVGLVINY